MHSRVGRYGTSIGSTIFLALLASLVTLLTWIKPIESRDKANCISVHKPTQFNRKKNLFKNLKTKKINFFVRLNQILDLILKIDPT